MKRTILIFALLGTLPLALFSQAKPAAKAKSAPAAPAKTAATSSGDLVLKAMRDELQRSKAELQLAQEKRPFYIEYALLDEDAQNLEASMGVLRSDIRARVRFARVLVRVGDAQRDNILGQNESTFEIAPLENDYAGLRHSLWLATDKGYKAALQQYTAKEAMLQQFEKPEFPVDDFSPAPVVESIGPLAEVKVDVEQWRKNLKDATAVGRKESRLHRFTGSAAFIARNTYFCNSEGSATRSGSTLFNLSLAGVVQADDGMKLDLDKAAVHGAATELPTAQEFVASAQDLVKNLMALRDSPVVEEQYRGPLMLDADATATAFDHLLGEAVKGKRPRPGDNARTTGAFANSYKSRVLPEFVNITDDPSVTTAAGRTLLGSYAVDDEAVRATAVSVVKDGVLINYLTNRRPIRDFPQSNGHGRATMRSAAEPNVGNLFITSREPKPAAQLRADFLEACRARSLAYCYRVAALGRGMTPRLLYRVYVADGKEELVRGARLEQFDVRSLRSDLVALGDDTRVSNNAGMVRYSVIAPSALFGEVEVKRSSNRKDKLPDYPAPTLAAP